MNDNMKSIGKFKAISARNFKDDPVYTVTKYFKAILGRNKVNDAVFIDSSYISVIGMAGFDYIYPAMHELFKKNDLRMFIDKNTKNKTSLLIIKTDSIKCFNHDNKNNIAEIKLNDDIIKSIEDVLFLIADKAGYLNENGEHCINLKSSTPGPHFSVNLLLGNRIGFNNSLLTTPKSVVDRLGGGSFRSHAHTQVLAIRWDLRQEEHGFPANRQFYLIENNKIIFYSYNPGDSNILSAECIHSQNKTTISYSTKCGLEIKRIIFILPQVNGFPVATEVQRIIIKNKTKNIRNIKIVYTGMFGTSVPGALQEDVLYSNIVMQSRVIKNNDGFILGISGDYYLEKYNTDQRFNSMIVYEKNNIRMPDEFCTDYNEFIGNGSLYNPDGIWHLTNNISRKGPGFFAFSSAFVIDDNDEKIMDNFTGLVSSVDNEMFSDNQISIELERLIGFFSNEKELNLYIEKNYDFFNDFQKYIVIKSDDKNYESYVNKNLPFQILYQTFVSRSFSLTQKSYRELGFREIQDLYASMYYFISMGHRDFVKNVLGTWAENIFESGYTYHNFFWKGKEAGKWSDDGLWFIQAVYRYLLFTGDVKFLDEEYNTAGDNSIKRSIYKTLQSVIKYSSEISIGKNGFPLIDKADWNDCLKVDTDYMTGEEKVKLYKESKNWDDDRKKLQKYSESIMNAFLLKKAIDNMAVISGLYSKTDDTDFYKNKSLLLKENLQMNAWKKDFFARIIFNRYDDIAYLGAGKDGLSSNINIDGTYYLNSFSWSVLSDCATEKQIETMTIILEKYLKTDYGYKLCTETDLNKISPDTATGEYFPGDRENGGIFKHASMMAVAAMIKASKEVNNINLAKQLSKMAYWMIDKVLPYNTMSDPYLKKGNPRFCTQYINSITGEHIGPLVSGTSTWLAIAIMDILGIEYTREGIIINPLLKEEDTLIQYGLNLKNTQYNLTIKKPAGFYRLKENKYNAVIDGVNNKNNIIPLFNDNKIHDILIEIK